MAKYYESKDILPGDFALRINQAYQEREKSNRELRKNIMDDLGSLLRLGGQSYDIYKRYKSFDESSLNKELVGLEEELKEINNELLMVNNQIRTIENTYRNNEDYQMGEINSEPSDIIPTTSFGSENYTGRF